MTLQCSNGVKVLCDNSPPVSWQNILDIDNALLLATKLLIRESLVSPPGCVTHLVTCVTLSWLMTHDTLSRCVTCPWCHETWHRCYRSLRSSAQCSDQEWYWSQSSALIVIMKWDFTKISSFYWRKVGWIFLKSCSSFSLDILFETYTQR